MVSTCWMVRTGWEVVAVALRGRMGWWGRPGDSEITVSAVLPQSSVKSGFNTNHLFKWLRKWTLQCILQSLVLSLKAAAGGTQHITHSSCNRLPDVSIPALLRASEDVSEGLCQHCTWHRSSHNMVKVQQTSEGEILSSTQRSRKWLWST